MVILTSFPPPNEGVRLRQENTRVHVQGKLLDAGTLFIAESRVSWMSRDGQGFSLEYPAISLHAVSRDLSAFSHHCLYLMVDGDLGGEVQNGSTESSSSEGEDEASKISEIRFIPEDSQALEEMYKVMSECQALHPDENDSSFEDDDDFGDGNDYYDAVEGAEHLTPEGQVTLSRLEAMLGPQVEMVEGEPTIGVLASEEGTNHVVEEDMETAQFDDADS